MTIAVTGNRILDQQARRGKSEADRSERKSASLAKKAAASGKRSARASVSRSRKSSGKSAGGRGGRGIVIKKAKSGKSAAGLLRYASEDSTAKLVLSNCGDTPEQQARFMRACANTNPQIKKPVGHVIVALPEGEEKSVEQWRKMVEHITRELGLDDTYPVAVYLHETEKGQDLHIAQSRVSLNGEVMNDSNDKYLMTSIEQSTEQKFNLKLVPRDKMKTTRENTPRVSHSEVKQAERTQIKPPRLVVSDAIKLAKKDKPTAQEFIKRLEAAGVVAMPYVHQNQVKGFSFSQDGQSFKGKDVLASWTTLKKELDYVEDRDLEPLAEHGRQARTDTRGIEPGEDRARETSDRARPAHIGIQEIEGPARGPDQPMEQPVRQVEQATSQAKAKAKAKAQELHGPSLGHPPLVDEDDPITKKLRARQSVTDHLRMETGERHKLAQELATRLEKADLYRQREAVKKFAEDHKADPHAADLVQKHLPEMAPAAPVRPPVLELPERLRLADRYQQPPPQNRDQDYQLPSL